MNGIVGLLLAAGNSRRFGKNKLLQPLPGGERILTSSARRLAAMTDRTIVLVRPRQPALRALLRDLDVELIEVDNAEAGMGVTLATGVQATAQAKGWVVALADMPRVQADTVSRVVSALREGASIAAPFHCGRRGHPVGFAQRWHDALIDLNGDRGAGNLLRAHADVVTRIDVDDPGCVFDVDTADDLSELVSLSRSNSGPG